MTDKPQPESKSPDDVTKAHGETRDAIKKQHPEWVEENGDCPKCVTHEYELADPDPKKVPRSTDSQET
jgi:hypothetical protein